MVQSVPLFKGSFHSPQSEFDGRGKRPVVFDILAPDHETSLLPDTLKLVLHVNPNTMKFSYAKIIERIHTKGGHVEQHFGQGAESISFEASTGAFMRLYTGLISITGGPHAIDVGGTRRETIAYDTYLDLLALFKNNGAIYDSRGNIVFQGIIKVTFDGDAWFGWFNTFSVSEAAEQPYQFTMSADFTISQEFMTLRTVIAQSSDTLSTINQNFTTLEQMQEDAAVAEERQQSADALNGVTSTGLGEEPATGATPGWVLSDRAGFLEE